MGRNEEKRKEQRLIRVAPEIRTTCYIDFFLSTNKFYILQVYINTDFPITLINNMINTRYITLILTLTFCQLALGQDAKETEVKTDISEVTVFMEGAQITRKKTVSLQSGTTLLKFTGLSPFINGKSIQVKAGNEVLVLAANHRNNVLDTLQRSTAIEALEEQLNDNAEKIRMERTHLEIVSEKLTFLRENRDIGGKNQPVSAADLKTASDYYGNSITRLKMEELERNKTIRTLNDEQSKLQEQMRSLTGKQEFASGEILVKVEAESATKANITLNYLVFNAGWNPSYDIRATDVNKPVTLVYKANVRQDTKVDWKNVKLKFSSANPNFSGSAPELRTWYLDYNSLPPNYERNIDEVSGFVYDEEGLPLPGASIMVKGTTIGTQTDFDGHFSLAVPGDQSKLVFSYVGMRTKELNPSRGTMIINLENDAQRLEEVVVVGYGSSKRSASDALRGKTAGVAIRGASSMSSQDSAPRGIPLETVRNQTTVDFAIEMPWSVPSDNQSRAVEMVRYNLPATYQYYAVPKVEKEAFLIARVTDWEQYHLMEGEANIFFENTYVGKSLLDIRYATEVLELSLGRDKNVSVNREKDLEHSDKKFIGSKKEETRRWKISIKNNKRTDINMLVLDQVPLSRLDEIDVDHENLSGGKLDEATGEVRWELELDPSEKKELILEYMVKYPKRNTLIVE